MWKGNVTDVVSGNVENFGFCDVFFVHRLKCVEILLSGMTEMNHVLSDFEIKLASYGEMPSELEALKAVCYSRDYHRCILYDFLRIRMLYRFIRIC